VAAGVIVRGVSARATCFLRALLLTLVSILAWPYGAFGSVASVSFQGDATHSGYLAGASVTPSLQQAWSRTLGAGVSYPLVADGRVFVYVASDQNPGATYALDAATGATLWSRQGGGSMAFDSGRLFVYDNQVVRALDPASGATLWVAQDPRGISLVASGGVLYDSSAYNVGHVYARNETSGALLWSKSFSAAGPLTYSATVAANSVIVAQQCAPTVGLNAVTGASQWTAAPVGTCSISQRANDFGSFAADAGGKMFVGQTAGTSGLTGEILNDLTGAGLGGFPATSSPLAVAGDTQLQLDGSTLDAVSASTGIPRWSFVGDGGLRSAPFVIGAMVFVGSASGMVYGLDLATGRALWSANTGAPILAAATIGSPLSGMAGEDGLLVVPASGRLVAYASSKVGGAAPPPSPTGPPPPSAAATSTATTYEQNPAHDGFLGDPLPVAPLVRAWSFPVSGETSYPVLGGGRVFAITTEAAASPGRPAVPNLTAVDPAAGSKLWSVPVSSSAEWAAPTYDNGRVLVAEESGLIDAFSPVDGSLLWSVSVSSHPSEVIFTPPVAFGGTLYVTISGGNFSALYALDEATGATLWREPINLGNGSSPTLDGTRVYGDWPCLRDAAFAAPTGALLWQHPGYCDYGSGADPASAHGGRIYSVSADGLVFDGVTGSVVDEFDFGETPAFAGNTALVMSGHAATLTALDIRTGTRLWTFHGDGTLNGAPVIVGGQVFVASGSGVLSALDLATGAVLDSQTLGAPYRPADQTSSAFPGAPPRSLAAGYGLLLVPVQGALTAYRAATATAPAVPLNQAVPVVSGSVAQGQTLTAVPGSWSGNPTDYAFEWERCTSGGADCATIPNATSSRYTLGPSDGGYVLRVKVTAFNDGGPSAPAASGTTGAVALPPPPNNATAPTISGTTVVGQTLTSDTGTWTQAPTSFSYQWERCDALALTCTAIPGAVSSSYLLTTADTGLTLATEVRATNSGGTSGPVPSSPTPPIAAAPPGPVPTVTAAPAINGIAQDGKTLKATTGTWTGSPSAYAYQWERCAPTGTSCLAVPGATAPSYPVSAIDVDSVLRVAVAASNASGSSPPALSTVTLPVTSTPQAPPTPKPPPPYEPAPTPKDGPKPSGPIAMTRAGLAGALRVIGHQTPESVATHGLAIRVTCVRACRARLELFADSIVSHPILLGSRRIHTAVGKTTTERIDLKRRRRSIIRRRATVHLTVIAVFSPPQSVTLSQTVTLRAAAGR